MQLTGTFYESLCHFQPVRIEYPLPIDLTKLKSPVSKRLNCSMLGMFFSKKCPPRYTTALFSDSLTVSGA